MAGCIDTKREPFDYEIANPEDFMLNYRYTLVNVIEVEHAMEWLMDKEVLDKIDQQVILGGYKTSVLKAGDLIDTVLRRGRRGFNALVEFIEYEYPEIYEKIMEKPAREPDHNVYVPARLRSTHLSQSFRQGFDLLIKALEDSKEAKNRAQRSIEKLQEKIEDAENELDMKHKQILELSERVLELTTINKELHVRLQQAEKERSEAVKQQEILRKDRDRYRDVRQEKLVAAIRSLMTSTKENQSKVRCSSVSKLESENEELKTDNKCLIKQFDHLAEKYDLFESSILAYTEEVKSLKEERDHALKQLEDLKEKHQTVQEENCQLKSTLLTYQSNLRLFKNENSAGRARLRQVQRDVNRNASTADLHRRLEQLESEFVSYHGSDAEEDRSESYTSRRK